MLSARVSKFLLCLWVLLFAACERVKPPTEEPAPTLHADRPAAGILPELENPRCLRSGDASGEVRCREFRVSIVELLANPAQWHNKSVVVIGFAAVSFEHSAIYMHRQDMEAAIMSNGLWLELPEDFSPSSELAKGEYVLVRGTFDAKAGGHLNAFNGTIRAAQVRPWAD